MLDAPARQLGYSQGNNILFSMMRLGIEFLDWWRNINACLLLTWLDLSRPHHRWDVWWLLLHNGLPRLPVLCQYIGLWQGVSLLVQSAFMQSVHLFAGLPLGRLPCILPLSSMWGYLAGFILLTWPKYRSLLVATLSMMVSSMFSWALICVFRILSSLVTPMIRLRHAISKVWSLFSSIFFSVHVSAPYSRIDSTRTL